MLQTCKPDSVPRISMVVIIYLSRQLLTGINLPTHPDTLACTKRAA